MKKRVVYRCSHSSGRHKVSNIVDTRFPSNVVFDYIVYFRFSHADQILAFYFQNG